MMPVRMAQIRNVGCPRGVPVGLCGYADERHGYVDECCDENGCDDDSPHLRDREFEMRRLERDDFKTDEGPWRKDDQAEYCEAIVDALSAERANHVH